LIMHAFGNSPATFARDAYRVRTLRFQV